MVATDVSGIILAGGTGSRMGQDKALVCHDGRAFLEIVAGRLAPIVTEVIVVGPERRLDSVDLRYIQDDVPSEGPLGGLITGLRRVQTEVALVLACDMPLVSLRVLRGLIDLYQPRDHAVVPRLRGVAQPLHSLYSTESLAVLEPAFELGARSIRRELATLNVRWVEISNAEDAESFLSIDTPQQLDGLDQT